MGSLTEEELIRLRINLFSVIQKTERLAIATMTLSQKQKNAIYSEAEIKAASLEVKHAKTMARAAAELALPALEALIERHATKTLEAV